MKTSYVPVPTTKKSNEIHEFLTGYWAKDIWDIRDPFFDKIRPEKQIIRKYIDFSRLPSGIKDEVKFFLGSCLDKRKLSLHRATSYGDTFNQLNTFLQKNYPKVKSFTEINIDKALLQWRTYLVSQGFNLKDNGRLSSGCYENLFNQVHSFIYNFYDEREEFEKDVWDVRKIPGAKYTQNRADYLLSFTDIPLPFRRLSKRYLKVRIGKFSFTTCEMDLRALCLFLKFIHNRYPHWKDLKLLARQDMEEYLIWYRTYTKGWKVAHYKYLTSLKIFLEYIQKSEYSEAPEKPSVMLLFKEDFPRRAEKSQEDIKFIPEGVLQQLEDNLEHLSPKKYIPVIIILRASGWRISDVLSLCYDNCLDKTSQGWWLVGDIPKTQVLNHRVPITDEVAAVVKAVAEEIKEKSGSDNNPNKLLFARITGKRKGRPLQGQVIYRALNRLAKKCNIVDDQGKLFHFSTHAFRHTKGMELINSGMNIVHVQKWMAHFSSQMTMRYAHILDTTMRKSWEEATKNGLFKIDAHGNAVKVETSDLENEDEIEWEYIRYNLDAVRMPLGYCMKPSKIECKHQLNPCLTCRNLCTTPDFIPQYELEMHEVKEVIQRGKAQGRTLWVEKNQALLERYETILATLKEGKTHHLAGKKGREFVGEERKNVEPQA